MDEALERFKEKVSISSDDELNGILSQGLDAYKKYELDMVKGELKRRYPEQYAEKPEVLGTGELYINSRFNTGISVYRCSFLWVDET